MFYTLVIVAIMIYCLIVFIKDANNCFEVVMFGLLGIISGLILSAIFMLLTGVIVSLTAESEYVKYDEQNIIALNDKGSLGGSLFLGSGYIEGSMKYVYMTSSDGEMTINSVGAKNTTLIYSDEKKIEKYSPEFKNKIVRILFDSDLFLSTKYKIYIPEGAIKQNFNVDLQ